MKFISSATAKVAVFALTAPASAATYTQAQVQMMVDSLEATKAARAVATVQVVPECADWNGSQARFYHGRKPAIKICAPEMDSPFDIQESVQHEAIHLAQWCRGSNSVYQISALKTEGRKAGFTADVDYAHEMASEHYDKSEYDSEFEAYYFMDSEGSEIAEIVNEAYQD